MAASNRKASNDREDLSNLLGQIVTGCCGLHANEDWGKFRDEGTTDTGDECGNEGGGIGRDQGDKLAEVTVGLNEGEVSELVLTSEQNVGPDSWEVELWK